MTPISWTEARAAEGPGLYDWLERVGLLELARSDDSNTRTLHRWRNGAWADFYCVDRLLIGLGLHPSAVPQELWSALSARTAAATQNARGQHAMAMEAP